MTQINIRIDESADEILTLLASLRKVSKTVVAREFMLEGLSQNLLPILLDLYREGKINLKKVIMLSQIPPREVLQKIADAGIEPPIPEAVDDYTRDVREELTKAFNEGKIKLKQPPPAYKKEKPLTPDELADE